MRWKTIAKWGGGIVAIAGVTGALTLNRLLALPDTQPERLAFIAQLIQDGVDHDHWPGAMWAIIKDGEILTVQAAGFADIENGRALNADTTMPIGSISKVITGLGAIRAVEDGHIGWDDPIADHLSFAVGLPDEAPRTLRHLVTHTSGILDSEAGYDEAGYHFGATQHPDDLARFLARYLSAEGDLFAAENFSDAPVGTGYDYSNIGAGLAGQTVADATGEDFAGYTMQHVVEPLGLSGFWGHTQAAPANSATLYERDADNQLAEIAPYGLATWPDGQFNASARDLARLLVASINEGRLDGNQALPAQAIATLTSPQRTGIDGMYLADDWIGTFWSGETIELPFYKLKVEGHSGGDPGVTTAMYRIAGTNDGFVFMTNGDAKNTWTLLHAARILRAMATVPDAL